MIHSLINKEVGLERGLSRSYNHYIISRYPVNIYVFITFCPLNEVEGLCDAGYARGTGSTRIIQ